MLEYSIIKIIKLIFANLIAISIIINISSCEKDDTEVLLATSIELVSGDRQSSEILKDLENPIIVIVKDQNGDAFAGALVNFMVYEGDISETSVTTGIDGKASVSWKQSSNIGDYTLTITAKSIEGTTELIGSPLFVSSMATKPTSVTDIDGNIYRAVQIGDRIWMAENLKTNKYNDGTEISLITDSITWNNLETPGYCWYNNDKTTNKDIYGALYNWYTVDTEKLCPIGWHVPRWGEWYELEYLLGSETGGKLKETGTTHWSEPNLYATNETGFTALPGGFRKSEGGFYNLWLDGTWWSSSETPILGANSDQAVNYSMRNNSGKMYTADYFTKKYGMSVRCVFDKHIY